MRVIVDDVRSLHNVGSIFRTSDAAGIDRLYLTGYTGTPLNPALHRTALGSQDVVPWEHHPDARLLVQRLRREGYGVAALEITDHPTYVETLGLDSFPICIVVGNEVEGVSERVLEVCDFALEIQQYGAKQSLNVSVAYGITVFDLVRRYRALRLQASRS